MLKNKQAGNLEAVPTLMSRKISKLNYENDYDFLLYGLICAHKDYKLCHELNAALQLDFHRKADVVVPAGKPGSSTSHSYFTCNDNDGELFHVITNRDMDGTGFFIPEMRSIDFFLILYDVAGVYDTVNLIKQVREIEIVSGAFEMDPSELKSAEAFLLFLEG